MESSCERLDKIRRQIEFYLSDSNIRHDKFLRSKLVKFNDRDSVGVPISLISTFNKMVKLNASEQDIINSISTSKLLFVKFETRTIHRYIPIDLEFCSIIPHERMLFIKGIPRHWSHKKIKQVLRAFGNVQVVKLPKANKSNFRRHYGFVEMETIQQTKNAIENFKNLYPNSRIDILPWSEWISTRRKYRMKSKH